MATEVHKPTSNFDIFKPDKRPLITRTALGNVFDDPDGGRKSRSRSRKLLSDVPRPFAPPDDSNIIFPAKGALVLEGPRSESRMRSRLGMQSQASFFIRHNPHPFRVRHIEGLNGAPVCAVHDHDYILLPRISQSNSPFRNPNSSFQLNDSQRLSLKPYALREKAVPRIGLIPMTSNWRDELQELCVKAGLQIDENYLPQRPTSPPPSPSGRKSVYSRETGRIMPPPSRALSRQSARSSSRHQQRDSFTHITPFPDTETLMLEMLCQILQTDSIQAVQQWLVAASDREKALVLDMIKTAMNVEEVKLHEPGGEEEQIFSSSPFPASRMETPRPPQKTPISNSRQAPRNRKSFSAKSRRSLGSRQTTRQTPRPPRATEKKGTFKFQKGLPSPTKFNSLPVISEEMPRSKEDAQ